MISTRPEAPDAPSSTEATKKGRLLSCKCADVRAKSTALAQVGATRLPKWEEAYHRPVGDVSAFVLAGGKSTRMGRDKALLLLDGQTLVERAVALARVVSNRVWIVGDVKKYSNFGVVIEDLYADRGPLGGIHAALSGTASQWNLMLAVDVPFLSPDFLKWMVEVGSKAAAVVTVPRTGGGLQPLSAVYHKRFASTAKAALEAGRNKVDACFKDVKTLVIEEDEIVRQGYSLEMFNNVNTPEEWERVVSSE